MKPLLVLSVMLIASCIAFSTPLTSEFAFEGASAPAASTPVQAFVHAPRFPLQPEPCSRNESLESVKCTEEEDNSEVEIAGLLLLGFPIWPQLDGDHYRTLNSRSADWASLHGPAASRLRC